jgi:hypothetical protein
MFQPEFAQMLRAWADETNAVFGEPLGKARILRQEPIARMHGLRARAQARGDDGVDIEIALLDRSGADGHSLVGIEHGPGETIRFGINRDGRHAETAQRTDNATGDFAPVGDQDFLEHGLMPPRKRKSARVPASD